MSRKREVEIEVTGDNLERAGCPQHKGLDKRGEESPPLVQVGREMRTVWVAPGKWVVYSAEVQSWYLFIFSVKQEMNYLQSVTVGGIQEALDELSDFKIAVIIGQGID